MNVGGLTGGILFHSVVIKWYKYDEIDTTLYENVFYTQLDENVRGMTILNAERITLDEFSSGKHLKSAARFAAEYHDPDFAKLKEMMGRGFKLFMHYMEYNAEYMVLADRMAVSD